LRLKKFLSSGFFLNVSKQNLFTAAVLNRENG
jgi:hypothetical protein